MADERVCEQCGTAFVPRREHARFCCVPCRVRWNREHVGDPAAGAAALLWSITAMSDAAERLPRVRAWDRPRAFVLISEAVWWVTIVDATLVRHHLDAYDRVIADQTPEQRDLIEQTLAGLRFVRNRIGDEADLAEFIEPSQNGQDASTWRIIVWTWKPVPESKPAALTAAKQAWELSRYQAYQAQLAGHTIGETFGRATAFLKRAVADAPALTDVSAQASH